MMPNPPTCAFGRIYTHDVNFLHLSQHPTTPKMLLLQVPRTVTEDVCVPVTVSQPRQDCRRVPREECDIMEMDETYQHCSVISDPREKTEKKCSYKVKSKNSQLL